MNLAFQFYFLCHCPLYYPPICLYKSFICIFYLISAPLSVKYLRILKKSHMHVYIISMYRFVHPHTYVSIFILVHCVYNCLYIFYCVCVFVCVNVTLSRVYFYICLQILANWISYYLFILSCTNKRMPEKSYGAIIMCRQSIHIIKLLLECQCLHSESFTSHLILFI